MGLHFADGEYWYDMTEARSNHMAEEHDLFHTVDFFAFGQQSGRAWREQYQESYADTYLEHVAAELQQRTYHLRRDCFPPDIIAAWQQGFRNGATQEEQESEE